jgi:PIN domain nuclease of toxin-antitoxin system
LKILITDTSALLAVLFSEPGSAEVESLFREAEQIFASGLLEAETRSAAARKNLPLGEVDEALSRLLFFHPDRDLTAEIKTVLSSGISLRGADLWHLACALYLAGGPSALPFLTLDGAQAEAAARLGFKVLPGSPASGVSVRETRAAYRAGPSRVKRVKRK